MVTATKTTAAAAERAYDEWYANWKAERAAARVRTEAALLAAFQAGKIVVEKYGDAWESRWSKANGTFIKSARTPEYLTAHLMSRHVGFGTDLFVDGVNIGMYAEAK